MATLFGVGNPDDAAPRLRVVRILHHRDVQLLSTGTERHVGGAISGSDREDVQQLAVGRDFQDFPAEPLGDVDIAFRVHRDRGHTAADGRRPTRGPVHLPVRDGGGA